MDELLNDVEIPAALSKIDPLVALLLSNRGVDSAESAQAFLSPDYEAGTHDPWKFKDMKLAVERILQAIKNDERIIIFSDYDTDGIPGAVVLHDFFTEIGFENFVNIIPHRNRDGFGLKDQHVEEFIKDEADLVITIDCGISSIDPITRAIDAGIDVIITDHHLPANEDGEQRLPPAIAVLDPQQAGCEYPNKDICGAGVVWQLVRALIDEGEHDVSNGFSKWLLDMVGIATVSDMVPLVGENRVLAYYGLIVLKQSRRPGLKALFKKARVSQEYLTETDVGFSIGPRINAASRMDEPMAAFELLATRDHDRADKLSAHLEKINKQRKGAVGAMTKQAHKKVKKQLAEQPDVPLIVVGSPKWKPSLAGLVATQLVDAYSRPVFVWGRSGGPNGEIRGSCRSDGVVDVYSLMQSAPDDVFTHCGGHVFSGGFGVTHENVHQLQDALIKTFASLETNTDEIQVIEKIDATVPLSAVEWQTWDALKQLAPFGKGNPQPVFSLEDVVIKEVKHFGKKNNHLKLILENGSADVEAIAFFKTDESFSVSLTPGKKVSLIANIEKDTFGYGPPSLRLRILDVK